MDFARGGILFGGDYNPDQWLRSPGVLAEDLRMMPLAGFNTATLGVFAWAALEPEEGRYEFEWLDRVVDGLFERGVSVALATPSGARPRWLSEKYPEVLRVGPGGMRNLHGGRHNHCPTSPVYRAKVAGINQRLAERYAKHPALALWHVSNEYGGECHCDLCQEAFRRWLQARYPGGLEELNGAWNAAFWGNTVTSWGQIHSPVPRGEMLLHGLNLDWKRFVTDTTADFLASEAGPLRKWAPGIPVTTNFMPNYSGLNYWKLARHLDVVSWDSYPNWHVEPAFYTPDEEAGDGPGTLWPGRPEMRWGLLTAFLHNMHRTMAAGRPFLMIESTPGVTNWQAVSKLPRPGVARLAGLQAVAHGSDAVMYFQWRKGRGGSEKFHGAVVDHAGHENTRTFREVAALGSELNALGAAVRGKVVSEAAIVYDWENRWAIEDARGPRNDGRKRYPGECLAHAAHFWAGGVSFDVVDMDCDLSRYKVVAAPMLYMVRAGAAGRISEFVRNGGAFICTFLSGWVDQNDLCFLGGFPGPLRKVLGIRAEEIDALPVGEGKRAVFAAGNPLGLEGEFHAWDFCELVHTEGAEVLATFGEDFYTGCPAITVNRFGKGSAYFLAARFEHAALARVYGAILAGLPITGLKDAKPEAGVVLQRRGRHVFLMNFTAQPRRVSLGGAQAPRLFPGGDSAGDSIDLAPFDVRILES